MAFLKTLYYASEDWSLMRSALLRANRILDRTQTGRDTDRLARRVMVLFDRGLRDEETIATSAAYQETLVANIAALRDTGASHERAS